MRGVHIALWIFFLGVIGGALFLSHHADRKKRGDRNMKTPAQRLVGQWQVLAASSNRLAERFYFGETGPDGTGDFFIVDPDGLVFHHRYEVVDQKRHGRWIRIRHFLSTHHARTEDLDVALNGLSAKHTQVSFEQLRTRPMRWIDGTMAPPLASAP